MQPAFLIRVFIGCFQSFAALGGRFLLSGMRKQPLFVGYTAEFWDWYDSCAPIAQILLLLPVWRYGTIEGEGSSPFTLFPNE